MTTNETTNAARAERLRKRIRELADEIEELKSELTDCEDELWDLTHEEDTEDEDEPD